MMNIYSNVSSPLQNFRSEAMCLGELAFKSEDACRKHKSPHMMVVNKLYLLYINDLIPIKGQHDELWTHLLWYVWLVWDELVQETIKTKSKSLSQARNQGDILLDLILLINII